MRIRGIEFKMHKNGRLTINKWRLTPEGADFVLTPSEVRALHALLKLHGDVVFTVEFGHEFTPDIRIQNRWSYQPGGYIVVVSDIGFYCQFDLGEALDLAEWLNGEIGKGKD